jgi:hypothetical protein
MSSARATGLRGPEQLLSFFSEFILMSGFFNVIGKYTTEHASLLWPTSGYLNF